MYCDMVPLQHFKALDFHAQQSGKCVYIYVIMCYVL